MKRLLSLVALIAVGLGSMSCSKDNPVSPCLLAEQQAAEAQTQLNAAQTQLNTAQAKATCLSRCEEDYSARVSQCFSHFWDSDKRDCVNNLNQTFETCKGQCEEDYSN